jgi:type IV pilus assembly protein PilK
VAMDEQAQTQASWQYTQTPAMDNLLFQQWVELLEKRTGIALPESRKTFLLTNLHGRMREVGCENYQEYFHLVTSGSRGQVEWEVLIDKLTVHETRFFRDANALELIRNSFLPALVEKASTPYTVHAWSVGCATGEEPYSLAILMEEFFKENENFYFGITASDVSRASLQTGRNAIYHVRRIKNVPKETADAYLIPVDEEHVQVESGLRQKVCFAHLNLLDLETLPLGMMDLILCQNVLIYFKRELRNQILNNLVKRLKPGGMIVLGAGEVFGWTHPELVLVNYESTLAFQRHTILEGTA